MAYLSHGCKGEKVRQLQSALNRAGSNLEVDGVYGSKTANAVRNFQEDHGLKVDGLAGPAVMEALAPYMQDYTTVTKAIEECAEAVSQLPEFKRLEALLYG